MKITIANLQDMHLQPVDARQDIASVELDLDEIESIIQDLLRICSRFDLTARFALQKVQNWDKVFSTTRESADVVYPKKSNSEGTEQQNG